MGHYNNATICLNGHVVSKYQANYQKFCSKCGKETYSKCPECNSPIHGKYEVDGIVDLSGSYNRPGTIAIIAEHHILGQKLF